MFDPRLESKLFQFYKQFCCLKKKVEESAGNGTAFPKVENYSLLPNASENTGAIYLVLNSQGTRWLPWNWGGTYYPKGLYYSNGIDWIFTKDIPYQATQAEVNAGTVNDKFVTPLTLENSSKWGTKADTSHTHVKADITDFAHTHPQSDITNLVADLAGKQETLVSGTNIKTINGNSLLGSGDIPVSGSGGISVILLADTGGIYTATNPNTPFAPFNFSVTAGKRYRFTIQGFVRSSTNTGHKPRITISATGFTSKYLNGWFSLNSTYVAPILTHTTTFVDYGSSTTSALGSFTPFKVEALYEAGSTTSGTITLGSQIAASGPNVSYNCTCVIEEF